MNALSLFNEKAGSYLDTMPIKKRNSLKVRLIKHLYQEGKKSIPELCHHARVSAPTLKRLLDELIEEGLVEEKGLGTSGGGRRPFMYGLNPDSRYILGIDIARFEIRMGLFNLSCQQVDELIILPQGLENCTDVIGLLKAQINTLLHEKKIKRDKILGIGIAFPGLIDLKTGISYTYFHKEGVPATRLFEKELKLPAFIEHDTRAMALGELMFGMAKGKKNVLCLNIGVGIGLSMILNGRV
ncbi:MAG: ROK family transcriptional regulator [Bacteroidetes bacterium]|nr:ROK family transcriptional regulator [Bacteroidota bacterium]